jgi:hypothetical protein
MYKCNNNFQSKYALVGGLGKTMTIDEYLESECEDVPVCIPHKHELIPVRCTMKKPHFRHKHNYDMEGTPMTEWHAEWQSNFPETERQFRNKAGQHKNRRADIVISKYNRILEIQHSQIASGEVSERVKDYNLHGYEVFWLIHSNENIIVKRIDKRLVLEFKANYWLYENFRCCNTVYYDINGFIYKLDPNQVNSRQVDVGQPKPKSEFIEEIQNEVAFWNSEEQIQSYVYLKQKGAGSGKTYGMIQLLNEDPEITNFKWVIFLTKQHSAVNVMYTEFLTQYIEKKLPNIDFFEEPKVINGKYDETQYLSGKQYIIEYQHKVTNVKTTAIFATVDSFTWSVGDNNRSAYDRFVGIISSIKEGFTKINKSGSLKYAGRNTIINKESIIMMDETQDLSVLYAEAFLKIVKSTSLNLCVVGDRLQSLSSNENTLTYLHSAEMAFMKIIKEDASNIVRRFSDPNLINFVNAMIPFEQYGLPKMTAHKNVDASDDALTIFTGKTVYADQDSEDDDIFKEIEKIMSYFKKEVELNHCLPEDFLIVTPFTNKNPLIEGLQLAINEYWKDVMENNNDYIENVRNKNDYWKNTNTNKYTRYAIFHKSQEMGSINLNESAKATRIVSIHSSKGDGRKVVFVIGVNQAALQMFSQVSANIIYYSLLHVSITRQKERLYFRLEQNNDDIDMRIKNAKLNISSESNIFFYKNRTINLPRLANNILITNYDNINDKIISDKVIPNLPKLSEKKLLIDMGDHNIRYSAMLINFMVHICNYELRTKQDTKQQFKRMLQGIHQDDIKPVNSWSKYIELLRTNNNTRKEQRDNWKKGLSNEEPEYYIPILEFATRKTDIDYQRYHRIIYKSMYRIISELQSLNKKEIGYFCPLESVILWYMLESKENGTYQKISINDVYNIVDIFDKAFNDTATGHENCECKEHFANSNRAKDTNLEKHQEYLRNHYDRMTHLSKLLTKFTDTYKNVNWLYNQPISYGSKDKHNASFNINNTYKLGYDKDNVYLFNLKPQFSEINFNEFKVNSLLDTWLMTHFKEKDNDFNNKFKNKRIISCVLSLDKDDIYKLDWTDTIKEKDELLKPYIRDTLFNHYSSIHSQIYETFMNICEEKQNYKEVIKICKSYNLTPGEDGVVQIPSHIPGYIQEWWKYLETTMDMCINKKEKNEMFLSYKDKEKFNNQIDIILLRSLNSYLNVDEEEED